MSELPRSWHVTSLGEIGFVQSGVGFPNEAQGLTSGDYPVYKVGDVSRSVLQTKGNLKSANNYVSTETAVSLKGYIFPAGSTLFAKIGEALKLNRRAFVIREGLADNNVMGYKAESGVSDRFIYHYLRTQDLAAFSRSTTVPSIRKGDVEEITVILPPADEQTRIAAKLDKLLAQVDTLKARVEKIPALLKRFRQSVLAHAVSGQLTEEWRCSNELASPTVSKFEDLLKDKGKLSYGVLKPGDADPEGVPMVRVMDIGEWGKIDSAEIFKISKALSDEYKRTVLEKGDILLSVMATIGRAAIVPENLAGGNVNRALAVIKLGNAVSAEFAFFQIMSPQFQLEFVEKQLGSAQRRINLSDLREFTVLVPVREEQAEIVRRVEQLFAFADQLESRLQVAQARINHLTQSILAKAFRGELVPQDPTDEPAIVLLERIKAQRTAAPKVKRGRRPAKLG
ncbi:restriction endonuclease subunit S [Pseudomonas putida]|uniref:restriction endonuclease subunit S n=1 Tax=Pseudomonas putida TaxID=303 RepID=UPI000CD3C0D3|nr:restriction endonuclease subunit S [Pseudomonas putida]WRW03150.1 restriction endonuclease subunit S [Pseudomonas putida]